MAGAEARAVWQRTVNRCFVQEDAKRAPKLACCQSSNLSSKQADEGGPTSATDIPDHPGLGFVPVNFNPSYSNLPPDARWWLQVQPSYTHQKGLTCDQFKALDAEVPKIGDKVSHKDKENTCNCGSKRNCSLRDTESMELKDVNEVSSLMDMDPTGCHKPRKGDEYCFDTESLWLESAKNTQWWRTTDKEDLASLVAQRSLDYFENCDLPPPLNVHARKYSSGGPGSSDHSGSPKFSLDQKAHTDTTPKFIHGSSKTFSSSTTHKGANETGEVPGPDQCKAQILEALRHSQTRAREAEAAAKQACAEKDDIIKLFFKQASQLFAYKQWFQLLQLETLYYHMKNIDQPMSGLFPVALPLMPHKGRKAHKRMKKSTKGGESNDDEEGRRGSLLVHDFGTYAVAFALGVGLVGAGFLLGWTVGWLFPF